MDLPRRYARPSGVSVIKYKSWDEFRQAMRSPYGDPNESRIYRGHASPNWKLSSTWERRIDHRFETKSLSSDPGLPRLLRASGRYEELRDTELAVFKRLIRTMPEIPLKQSDPDEDWWAFGRHYGLNTPLLDWSRNLYIAAFWAFSERLIFERPHLAPIGGPNSYSESDLCDHVVVWELLCSDDVFAGRSFCLIDNVRPELHRQRSQGGLFTWLNHSEYIDVERYLDAKGLASNLKRHEIGFAPEMEVLYDLDSMGINYASVFPDPDGAARQSIFSSRGFVESNLFAIHADCSIQISK